jgi:hypothetical protein
LPFESIYLGVTAELVGRTEEVPVGGNPQALWIAVDKIVELLH